MKLAIKVIAGIIVLVVLSLVTGLVYTVNETQQVVITQFGRPIGKPITTAGLHFKKPFIQQTHYFEKRILEWDGDPNQIPTKDKKYIWIDTTARWKIANALLFLQSVHNEIGAQARLDDILNSATRDIITSNPLVATVRNSNQILEKQEEGEDIIVTEEAVEKISTGRQAVERAILKRARKLAPQYGIELVDVRIKRVNYVQEVRNKVYERMIAERKRAAERYRSEGQGRKAEIDGQREKEMKLITSEAYRTSQGVKGKADAETVNIYAGAYGADPEFYSFQKTLETYGKTVDKNTTLIMTTDSDYYKYMQNIQGE
ncbi:MAG: protease modulator HflC [Candidatus Ancaeobacter aquaticus]|nr:protease modulator HflC [Candidatus Ancaeobacter aquaticus]